MRKKRDSLMQQVDDLSDTNATQLDQLHSNLQERDDLAERVDSLKTDLATLHRNLDYRLPDGHLKLEKLPCKNEVLWSSPGLLEPHN
jgi:ABC-type transporter Mla subunit MlaD